MFFKLILILLASFMFCSFFILIPIASYFNSGFNKNEKYYGGKNNEKNNN
jgi:hypothetical protein